MDVKINNINKVEELLKEIKILVHLPRTNISDTKNQKWVLKEHSKIPGLYYCDSIIDEETESQLIKNINQSHWITELSRRVQHYGYRYDYKKRKINKNDYLGELPDWSKELEKDIWNAIKEKGLNLPYNKFDQLIVNEYKNNQGISAHVDCVPCFNDGIITLTLGCGGIMTFINKETNETHDIFLKQRSFAIMTGDSRYKWTHEINKSKNKYFTNDTPRISLTYRKCIL